MPHDKNGAPLQVGDEVLIRAKVERIYPDAATCNGQFRTTEKMTEDSSAGDLLTLNCNQVEKAAVEIADPVLSSPAEGVVEEAAQIPAEPEAVVST